MHNTFCKNFDSIIQIIHNFRKNNPEAQAFFRWTLHKDNLVAISHEVVFSPYYHLRNPLRPQNDINDGVNVGNINFSVTIDIGV